LLYWTALSGLSQALFRCEEIRETARVHRTA
jgi:hypothetical protein